MINPDSFIHDTIEFVSKLIYDNVYDPENPSQKVRAVPSFPTEVRIPSISIFKMSGAYTKRLGVILNVQTRADFFGLYLGLK